MINFFIKEGLVDVVNNLIQPERITFKNYKNIKDIKKGNFKGSEEELISKLGNYFVFGEEELFRLKNNNKEYLIVNIKNPPKFNDFYLIHGDLVKDICCCHGHSSWNLIENIFSHFGVNYITVGVERSFFIKSVFDTYDRRVREDKTILPLSKENNLLVYKKK